MRITKEFNFSSGHMLPNHKGKCSRPHGHNYRLEVTVEGIVKPQNGESDEDMVLDFGDLKTYVQPWVDLLDHRFIVCGDEWFYAMFQAVRDDVDFRNENSIHIPDLEEYMPFASIGVRTTAENLARWFVWHITDEIVLRRKGNIHCVGVTIWETPTSSASYEKEIVE